ncbi:MAG: hypothetical protein ACE5E6_03080 [Phycisphaerae bacterium]
MSWWRHAFAVDPPGPAEPTEDEQPVVDAMLNKVVRRGMVTPTILALESLRNMNYIASQVLTFAGPVATVLLPPKDYERFAGFLERRGSVDYMIRRLEALDAERKAPGSDGVAPDSGAPSPVQPAAHGSQDGPAPAPNHTSNV